MCVMMSGMGLAQQWYPAAMSCSGIEDEEECRTSTDCKWHVLSSLDAQFGGVPSCAPLMAPLVGESCPLHGYMLCSDQEDQVACETLAAQCMWMHLPSGDSCNGETEENVEEEAFECVPRGEVEATMLGGDFSSNDDITRFAAYSLAAMACHSAGEGACGSINSDALPAGAGALVSAPASTGGSDGDGDVGGGGSNTMMYVGGGAVVLVVIGAVVFFSGACSSEKSDDKVNGMEMGNRK